MPTYSDVFCDFLNVSCFKDASFIDPAIDVIREVGVTQVSPNLYRVGGGGTVKIIEPRMHKERHTLSLSGQALKTLRDDGLLGPLVQEMSAVESRVAQLHASRDTFGVTTPDELQRLLTMGREGLIKLGRKRLRPSDVDFQDNLDDLGRKTGTVYFGNRHRQRKSMHVYDKRWEQIRKFNRDPGQEILRIETVAKQGTACLNDVLSPTSMFYSIASDIVDVPADVQQWTPSDLFEMETMTRHVKPIDDRIEDLLYQSADLRRLAKLMREMPGHDRAIKSRLLDQLEAFRAADHPNASAA